MAEAAHAVPVTFVESAVFTRRVVRLGLEEPLRKLQLHLAENPTAGRLDSGTGGLRKVRIPDPARAQGKSGGARVHYLWVPASQRVYFLFVYSKEEAGALTADQKKALSAVVRAIKQKLSGEARNRQG